MERPILFSTAMVQAILEGRKTQTRRVIKAPVLRNVREPDEVLFDGKICKFNWHGDDVIGGFEIKPKYQPGDILWVKEKTFGTVRGIDNQDLCYATHCPCGYSDEEHAKVKGWRPSIHMPRKAARLFLKVINVKVERLQSISRMDIKAEGIYQACLNCGKGECVDTLDCGLKQGFKNIWDSLNKKRGYGWDANPWVWVIEFEKQ